MRVWAVFPTCNPERATACAKLWKSKGYLVAIGTEKGFPPIPSVDAHIEWNMYEGYWKSANRLGKNVAPFADYVVYIGDDMEPDPTFTAQEIAASLAGHSPEVVMQPIGDTAMPGTDRICGSPWVTSTSAADGVYHEGYWQFYGDEELFEKSKRDGLLIQRSDLIQKHHHWCRPGAGIKRTEYQERNSKMYWDMDKKLFMERKEKGFPG